MAPSKWKLAEGISWHLYTCWAASLPFDLLTDHPTCCCSPLLWSLGDVRWPEFVGHSDDSDHLAVKWLSAHQNKHRKVYLSPMTEFQRLTTDNASNPDVSNPKGVGIKGSPWRSRLTFIPENVDVFFSWTPVWNTFWQNLFELYLPHMVDNNLCVSVKETKMHPTYKSTTCLSPFSHFRLQAQNLLELRCVDKDT